MEKQKTDTSQHGREGYALMTVLVFVVVLLVAGAGFFAMSFYETRQTLYRQESAEAFYLADGAIERARAQFIEDRTWRDGWANVACGRGEYSLSVNDTALTGHPNAVRIVADGQVLRGHRRVEVFADLPASAWELTTLVKGTANIGGNLCLIGPLHCDDPAFDPTHVRCGGTTTSGFPITPPQMYTDAGHFPHATYYAVRGHKIGSTYQARIYNALGQDVTTALRDSLCVAPFDVTTYNSATNSFTYSFDNNARIDHYFNEATGIFAKAPGDNYVVVNFGETAIVNPPGVNGISNLVFDGSTGDIRTTIVNTRFTGASDDQRTDTNYWTGGQTIVRQIEFEPRGGIALLVHDFERQGAALTQIGTTTWPALVYCTHDVNDVNSNVNLVGSIMVLGNWSSTGGPNLTYDAGFLVNIPDYLKDQWQSGVSGTLTGLRWREVPAS